MKRKLLIALTLMASGRAMTLFFIGRAGNGLPGDPPDVWLMPLIGDAVVGLAALVVAALLLLRPTPGVWVIAVVWSAIGAFDALAAFIVETTAPWPEFFMLEVFGRSMFFAATAMHLLILFLLTRPDLRTQFALSPANPRSPAAT